MYFFKELPISLMVIWFLIDFACVNFVHIGAVPWLLPWNEFRAIFFIFFFKFLVTRNCCILFSLLSPVPKPHSSSLKSSLSSLYFKWVIMIFSPFQDNLLYAVWLMMVRYIFVTSHLNTFNVIFLSGHCSCSRFCAVNASEVTFQSY